GGGFAARQNQGKTTQRGLVDFRNNGPRVGRGAGENVDDGGALGPGKFAARPEGGCEISGFEIGGFIGRREGFHVHVLYLRGLHGPVSGGTTPKTPRHKLCASYSHDARRGPAAGGRGVAISPQAIEA